jgi:hypothetical protein
VIFIWYLSDAVMHGTGNGNGNGYGDGYGDGNGDDRGKRAILF